MLLIQRNGDAYFTGDLKKAKVAIEKEGMRIVNLAKKEGYVVEIRDFPWRNRDAAEWGGAPTLEEALRFAIGAHYGPLDELYDEEYLEGLLNSEED